MFTFIVIASSLLLISFGLLIFSCDDGVKKPSKTKSKSLKEIQLENLSIENELRHKLSSHLINIIDQKAFNYKCVPVINKLNERNPRKYKMIHTISVKLSKESNEDVYNLGLDFLKKELVKSGNY